MILVVPFQIPPTAVGGSFKFGLAAEKIAIGEFLGRPLL
jgi:hypothetical protein